MTEPRRTTNLDVWKCADLGLRLAVALGLGAYGGYRFDSWLDSKPLGILIGCMLGLAIGMTMVVRTVSALQQQGPDDDEA
jgi:F0F1-type ATP synthase assembly protein I